MITEFQDDLTVQTPSGIDERTDDIFICKICNEKYESEPLFTKHLRKHDILKVAYWQQYWPRHDLFDGSIIKFKSLQDYLAADFNTKTNLKRYLSRLSEQSAKDYCRKILTYRKNEKGALITPTQVELRSILSPSILYFDELFAKDEGYYKLCADLGFKSRFSPIDEKQFINPTVDKTKFKIIIDSREQKPLKFSLATEVKKLDYGDYALDHSGFSNVNIERKSISDLIGTMSSGYERFQREIERAREASCYLVILVEEDFNSALSFNYLPHVFKTKITPEFVFHNVRELCQKYKHLQFLFVAGRKEASRVVEKIFMLPGLHQNFDLQLAYDRKLL